jgi:phosphoribosylpyrophosphate synthetase
MKLVTGNANLTVAKAVSDYLEIPLTDASVKRFADKEIFVEIHENVRGEDVFILQSTSYPANDHLMELLILIDAMPASPISAMRVRTANRRRAPRSRPSSWPISSPTQAPTVS